MSLLTYPQLEHMLVVSTAIALGLYCTVLFCTDFIVLYCIVRYNAITALLW